MKFKRRSFKSHREKESEEKFYSGKFVEYFFLDKIWKEMIIGFFKKETNFERGVY